jgi:hypothetical protein
MRWMYDASHPPVNPPKWHVVAGYIGGNTPYVWSESDWDHQPAPRRLPIWTGAGAENTETAGQSACSEILHALRALSVPTGVSVALDMETDVSPVYAETIGYGLEINSYHLVIYGSADSIDQYPTIFPSLWVADWSDTFNQAIDTIGGRVVAVQWQSAEEMQTDYDFSLIEGNIPLW